MMEEGSLIPKSQNPTPIEKLALGHAWGVVLKGFENEEVYNLLGYMQVMANTTGDQVVSDYMRQATSDAKKAIEFIKSQRLLNCADYIARNVRVTDYLTDKNQEVYEGLIALLKERHYLDDLSKGYHGIDPNAESTRL